MSMITTITLPLAKPLVCRLLLHLPPRYAREADGTASWECGTATCLRRWRRFLQDGDWRPEHERDVREARILMGLEAPKP